MDELSVKVSSVLTELKMASMSVNDSEERLRKIINTYDTVFMGERFSVINALELWHSLNKRFNIDITREKLNELLPTVCHALDMKCEAMIKATDAGKPNPETYTYLITLW